MSTQWPERYANLREHLIVKWKIKDGLIILQEFSDGKSAAKVYRVDLKRPDYKGQAILKLDTIHNWGVPEAGEAERHKLAYARDTKFTEEHIPRLIDSVEFGGQVALLYGIAGDSLENSLALNRLDAFKQQITTAALSSDLLRAWNRSYSTELHTAQSLLKQWLGYRLEPSQGGRILDFLDRECKIDPMCSGFIIGGETYPNPYYFALASGELNVEHIAAFGGIHGDLHARNVIAHISSNPRPRYHVIDFALYHNNAPLFYDHAYLEFSILIEKRSACGLERFLSILKSIDIIGQDVDIEDRGIIELIASCRKSIREWILSYEQNRQDDMNAQYLLARIAVGLNFVNKPLDSPSKLRALIYAAHSLREYYYRRKLPMTETNVAISIQAGAQVAGNRWQEFWDACDRFDTQRNTYILVTDAGVRGLGNDSLAALGRLPWSFIIDLDIHSESDGFLTYATKPRTRGRSLRKASYNNIPKDINFLEATCWLSAADSQSRDFSAWRRRYLKVIRDLCDNLRKSSPPSPVMVIFLKYDTSIEYIREIWGALDEILGDAAEYVIVDNKPIQVDFISANKNINCQLADVSYCLLQMIGVDGKQDHVFLPSRMKEGDEKCFVLLADEDLNYLKEDLEVVYDEADWIERPDYKPGEDFWRGYQITWTELAMDADIRRDVAEAVKSDILDYLKNKRSYSISLCHAPGAGGTTIARRIAWDLRDIFPVLVIKRLSQHTADRIARVYDITSLPILVIVEAAIVSEQDRTWLYTELRARNVPIVFLYVLRSVRPRGEHYVDGVMSVSEAKRFFDKYQKIAPTDRISILRKLAESEEFRGARSPFFFGLYAFERDFVHIPDFVRAHITEISAGARKALGFIALITRYSQAALLTTLLAKMLGLPKQKAFRLSSAFGDEASRLLLARDLRVRILHPLVAEEVLRQLMAPEGIQQSTPSDYKLKLADLAASFIQDLAKVADTDNEDVLSLMEQLFIHREAWDDALDRRRHFSELILDIPLESGQNRVLNELVTYFPTQAHFWNHLGRHHMYVMRSDYKQAENCLLKAIDLEENNDIHHHALGMVYRFEVRSRLSNMQPKDTHQERDFAEIFALTEQAEQCFKQSRNLDPETNYGYVTNMQLLIEVINRLFSLSGNKTYAEFLASTNNTAIWSRDKVPQIELLLREARRLYVEETTVSSYVRECEAKLMGIYDNLESMIESLQAILQRDSARKIPIRRLLANTYYAKKRHVGNLTTKDWAKIQNLTSANLEEDPGNGRDIWLWFQSARSLPKFDMLDAMTHIGSWALREESVEAEYYLYMLHFLRYQQGILADHRLVKQHIERCKQLASKYRLRRTTSYYWLARHPDSCPIIEHHELGDWDKEQRFFKNTKPLCRITGKVGQIAPHSQSGTLLIGDIEAFFVPAVSKLLPGKDENKRVSFFLGFSYDGLRAWSVELEDSKKWDLPPEWGM